MHEWVQVGPMLGLLLLLSLMCSVLDFLSHCEGDQVHGCVQAGQMLVLLLLLNSPFLFLWRCEGFYSA